MADPKDIQSLFMARLGKKGAPPPDEGAPAPEMDAGGGPLEDAMNDLIAAIQGGDAKGAATAFQTAFKACEMEPHMEAGETG